MKPNFHPEGMNYESMKTSSEKQETIPQLWRLNGNCPKGTIPIRRTKKEDILRASSINKYGKKTSQSTVAHPTSVDLDLINQSGHQVSCTLYITTWSTQLNHVTSFNSCTLHLTRINLFS